MAPASGGLVRQLCPPGHPTQNHPTPASQTGQCYDLPLIPTGLLLLSQHFVLTAGNVREAESRAEVKLQDETGRDTCVRAETAAEIGIEDGTVSRRVSGAIAYCWFAVG